MITLEDLYDMIREQQKLLEKILKLLEDRNEEVSDEWIPKTRMAT